MPFFLALFLSAVMPLNLGAAMSSPQKPIPPVISGNVRSYWFGAEQDGKPAVPPDESEGPTGSPSQGDQEQTIGPHECKIVGDNVQVCVPVRGKKVRMKISPAELAVAMWARLPIPAPHARMAPPRSDGGMVGLPEWFWVTNWRPIGGRVRAGDMKVKVTARPENLAIDPGDGSSGIRCAGPGAAYDKSRPAASQHTDCSYTFRRPSVHAPRRAFRVRVVVTWGGVWRASDGSNGKLPPLTRSSISWLEIAEAQGLYG